VLKNFEGPFSLFLSGWHAAVPFQDFRTIEKHSFAPKRTREINDVRKVVSNFLAIPILFQLYNHFYKEIP